MENAVKDHPDLFSAEVIGFGDGIVFVNHPEAIKELLSKDRQRFPALGSENKILRPLVGDNSIFLISGDRHQNAVSFYYLLFMVKGCIFMAN
ncbi:MAG: hypothetical protein HC930_17705 [Hydrococcus sp. SU_1_0]|nr:hypothetical protein [Hydrococcus sp. SU_1_0]